MCHHSNISQALRVRGAACTTLRCDHNPESRKLPTPVLLFHDIAATQQKGPSNPAGHRITFARMPGTSSWWMTCITIARPSSTQLGRAGQDKEEAPTLPSRGSEAAWHWQTGSVSPSRKLQQLPAWEVSPKRPRAPRKRPSASSWLKEPPAR